MVVRWVVFFELHDGRLPVGADGHLGELATDLFNLDFVFLADFNRGFLLGGLLINFDVDFLWSEFDRRNFFSHALDDMLIFFHGDAKDDGEDVGACLHNFQVEGVVQVQINHIGSPLESAPKCLSSFFDDVVLREGVQQLSHLVMEHIVEDID